jgi:hypothetical protein
MFVHILFSCHVKDGAVQGTDPQSRKLYDYGYDLAKQVTKGVAVG